MTLVNIKTIYLADLVPRLDKLYEKKDLTTAEYMQISLSLKILEQITALRQTLEAK